MGLKEVSGVSHMAIWGKCGPEREVVGLPEGERGTHVSRAGTVRGSCRWWQVFIQGLMAHSLDFQRLY